MEITPHQQAFLQTLIEQNIELTGHHWSLGIVSLRPDQVEAFIQDSDQFAAEQYGVSKEQFLSWKGFSGWPQCLGATQRGKQCGNLANYGHRVNHPKLFVGSNQDCYCNLHRAAHKSVRGG